MCGIFGFIANNNADITKGELTGALGSLVKLSQRRGCEAAGFSILSGSKISVYKKAKNPTAMLKSASFKSYIDSSVVDAPRSGKMIITAPIIAIGHTRLVTNGSQAIAENNQPINAGHMVGVHNGIITNDEYLRQQHPELKDLPGSHSGSDTWVLYNLLNKYYEIEKGVPGAIRRIYREVEGSASIGFLCDLSASMVIATNMGALYYWSDARQGVFVFGSERFIVEGFLRKNSLKLIYDVKSVRQLEPFTAAVINAEDLAPQVFKLSDDHAESPMISSNIKIYDIIDLSVTHTALRRCTKCVLPHTYPFITFDEDGVCNYCRKYKKQEFLGKEALEEVLARYRSKNGEPDCIVGFSGGRDSSYGLHVLKTEFNMHPIAYTYDWAMVTDLARRNQARITGKLGVEHLIRAADIHAKRRYIRKNIYAWLKKPSLGMVPLFMAGDKMFYYYGRQLRKETGIKLTVFAAGQQLEQMEFKIGFCGVDQDLVNNTKLYNYNTMVKARIALWYIKEYVTNPAYINESFLDSIFAYYASFISKDDYVYLFRYLPWDEKLIERTLKEEYGWEANERYGKNQWRMGDGHTAFIDYIYHTVAGFSEFDNFRSNQVREGLITRDEAMKLTEEDNKPRLEMLQEFGQLIGFNLEEVLLRINEIPKLY
ncbi:MAG: hypothetical protein KKE81_05800 [Candidatus Omnitrophica bacterium]|nr:hypothetical protein [Candidatus Omnitrophota bacterium]MBU1808075.1 hypothetical protein [Candidatus Omnitrophota bacterium]